MDSADFSPKLDVKVIEETTKLPSLKVEKELPEQIETIVVVLKSTDLDNLPDFLKCINESPYMQSDLKTKKSLFIYGRSGDKFKKCFIKVSTFSTYTDTLSDAGTLTRTLLGSSLTSCSIYFSPSIESDQISTFIQGVCLTNYKFDRKTEPSAIFKKIQSITIYHPQFDINKVTCIAEKSQFIINSAKYPLFCREVLNTRALEANPETMLDLCKQIVHNLPNVTMEAIVGKELQTHGLNLIYAVGRGGPKPPCLVVLKYTGNPEKPEDIVALIGKGVCFDTGGLNIKGTGSIENMYNDKGGACTVLSVIKGLAELKLPVNVVCGMAFVENSVGADAYHPLDIIKSYKGLTVEIGNTDAEGRLILADTMTYTQLKYKPHTMIELSTLTGAIRQAIGGTHAGLFTNSKRLGKALKQAGKEVGELLWKMPLLSDHREAMKGAHGDLTNKGKVTTPGASNAGGFLQCFVEKGVFWAHLDIAAVKSSESDKYVYSTGANGWGVQLLFTFLLSNRGKILDPQEGDPEVIEDSN